MAKRSVCCAFTLTVGSTLATIRRTAYRHIQQDFGAELLADLHHRIERKVFRIETPVRHVQFFRSHAECTSCLPMCGPMRSAISSGTLIRIVGVLAYTAIPNFPRSSYRRKIHGR